MTAKSWQRMALSLLAIGIIASMWRWSIMYLYTLPTDALASFTTLTTNSMYTISSVVIFMISGRMLYEWKMNTSSINSVTSMAQDIKQDITKNINVKIAKTHDFDDGASDLDITELDLK